MPRWRKLELIVIREGDFGRMSWSPFMTLRRLIGNSLFNYVGPETSHQRNVLIREFNNTKAIAEKFDTIAKIATAHASALTNGALTAEIGDIKDSADDFAIALWGDILYGNPNNHVGGQLLHLSETIMDLAGNPWASVWYSLHLFLKLVTPGEPTRSEARLRATMDKAVQNNIEKLEDYERNNPYGPLKTIRSISIISGGGNTGPLSKFGSEFCNLNIFGSSPFLPFLKETNLMGLRRSSQHRVECRLVIDRAQQAFQVLHEASGRNRLC